MSDRTVYLLAAAAVALALAALVFARRAEEPDYEGVEEDA